MYWTPKRLKELKERGYKLRSMTVAEANAEVTSEELQAQEAASAKRAQPEVASDKQIESLFLNPSFSSAKILVPGNNLQEP